MKIFRVIILGFFGLLLVHVGSENSLQATHAAIGDPTYPVYFPQIMRPPTGPDWLIYINNQRSLANLPSLLENASWSSGCWNHARYMVKNNMIGHSEETGNPWYSTEGDAAARNANVMVSSSTTYSDEDAIDMWLSGPFHGVGILDPQLGSTGYGSYREADGGWQMGGCVDVLRGLGSLPPTVNFPIKWPENGRVMPYLSYNGNEYPNPISGCGFSAPSGPPIYLMLGQGGLIPTVSDHSFRLGSTNLEHCVYSETTYTFPGDSSGQSLGRSVLNSRDAIILMPRNPLSAGTTYTVSITANGADHTWSFTTTATPSMLAPLELGVEYEFR